MNLEPTDEQQALREAVRGVVTRDASLARVRGWVLEDGVDHAPACALAAAQGWTGIGIPEEAGGQGGGLLDAAIIAEELGRGAVPADALYASLLAGQALLRAGGSAEQLAALADGDVAGALLVSGTQPLDEASTGGALPLVLGAPGAELLVDTAFTVVDPGDVTVTPRRLLDRTRNVGDVERADTSRGAPAAGLRDVAAWGAVLIAADALGACQHMLDLTVEYVGQRVQFGVAVGSFQAVKHRAAGMLVAIEGLRAVVNYAAWAVGEDEEGAHVDAWVAKARAARVATDVADGALFLHGAVGYTWEHDLQLLFKRAKSDAELLGGAAVHENRIADALALVPPP